jgi:pyruvate carboxylase subunit B
MPEFSVEEYTQKYTHAVPVQAPVKGQLLWQVDVEDDSAAPIVGTAVKAGEPVGYVQTYYGREEIPAARDGRIVAVLGKQGKNVVKGEIVAFVE